MPRGAGALRSVVEKASKQELKGRSVSTSPSSQTGRERAVVAAVVVGLQLLAAGFFVVDSWAERDEGGLALMELFIALALLIGAVFGAVAFRHLLAEARRREDTLGLARGALSELIKRRFADWQLSKSEAEVALFALKGCTISEIAGLRRAAEGTVRSQLSQVYAKAGVKNQSMLMALFIDDLVEPLIA